MSGISTSGRQMTTAAAVALSEPVGLRRCHDCDLLVEIGRVPSGTSVDCGRCGAELFAHKKDPIRRALALYLS
jgi:uncharacterized paraquat-inducible protein A